MSSLMFTWWLPWYACMLQQQLILGAWTEIFLQIYSKFDLNHCCDEVWFALCVGEHVTSEGVITRSPFPPLIARGWENRDNTAGAFLWKKRQSRVEIWRFLQVSQKSYSVISSYHIEPPTAPTFSGFVCVNCSFVHVSFCWWRYLSASLCRPSRSSRFMDNLQTEVLEIEFLSYSKGLPTISEEDFARILLRYTNVDDVSGYLENVRHGIPDEKVCCFFPSSDSLCHHVTSDSCLS